MSISRGGADATVKREFDLQQKTFVDGGFQLPEAKSRVAWKSADILLVGTDFGEGSLTDSGYPRLVKAQPLHPLRPMTPPKTSSLPPSLPYTLSPFVFTPFREPTRQDYPTLPLKPPAPHSSSPAFPGVLPDV